jgi:serine/threonine protein kinase
MFSFFFKTICSSDKILAQLRPGAQGYVYVVDEVKTGLQFVMKAIFVENVPQGEVEEMITNWKKFNLSKGKNYFVKYFEHFYENKFCSFLFFNLTCLFIYLFISVIVMEWCKDGDLETVILKNLAENKKFSEEVLCVSLICISSCPFFFLLRKDLVKVLIDGMKGLDEMHTEKCMHRDIKSANFLKGEDGTFKLCLLC